MILYLIFAIIVTQASADEVRYVNIPQGVSSISLNIPNCPYVPLSNCNTTLNTGPSILESWYGLQSINATFLTTVGTGCKGVYVYATNKYDNVLITLHEIIRLPKSGDILEINSYAGINQLFICPGRESAFIITQDKSATLNWNYLSATMPLKMAQNLPVSTKVSYQVGPSSGDQLALLIIAKNCVPRLETSSLYASDISSIMQTTSVDNMITFITIKMVSGNITIKRDLEEITSIRYWTEQSCSIEIYEEISSLTVLHTPARAVIGCENGMIISMPTYHSIDNRHIPIVFRLPGECIITNFTTFIAGKTYVMISSGVIPLSLSDLEYYFPFLYNNFHRLSNYDVFDSISNLAPPIIPSSACYAHINSLFPLCTKKPMLDADLVDYTLCQKMIKWPCVQSSDCNLDKYGVTSTCNLTTHLCRFSDTQIFNCTLTVMNSSLKSLILAKYGNIAGLITQFKRTLPVPTLKMGSYKVDPFCVDGCLPSIDYLGNLHQCDSAPLSCKRSERKLIKSPQNKCEFSDSLLCDIQTTNNCIENSGYGYSIAKQCATYCGAVGYEAYTQTSCNNFLTYMNRTYTNFGVVVALNDWNNDGLNSCQIGNMLIYGAYNYTTPLAANFIDNCTRSVSGSLISSSTYDITLPIGSLIPPRYITPVSVNTTYYYKEGDKYFTDWSAYFEEITASFAIVQDINCDYYNIVYTSLDTPNTPINDSILYLAAIGTNVSFSLPEQNITIISSLGNEFQVHISPSGDIIEVRTFGATEGVNISITLCINGACDNHIINYLSPYRYGSSRGYCLNGVYTSQISPTTHQPTPSSATSNPTVPSPPALISEIWIVTDTVATVAPNKTYTVNSDWTININVSVSGQLVLSNARVLIQGDLNITGNLLYNGASRLDVLGCLYLNGTLTINNIKSNTILVTHNGCVVGSFSSYEVIGPAGIVYCDVNLIYAETSISILFTTSESSCDSEEMDDATLAMIISIPLGVVVIIIIIIVFLKVKAVRKEIAPFHDRKKHIFTTNTKKHFRRPTREKA